MAIIVRASHEDKILLVDFDDTIAQYQGLPPNVPGDPLPGVLEFLPRLHQDGWQIHIFSGRSNHPEGTKQIADWMDQHNLPYHAIIPNKPQYNIIVDDCSIPVDKEGWAPIYTKINSGTIGIKAAAPGSKNFDFSSTHVVLPKEIADKLIAWGQNNVPDSILDKEEGSQGREDYPHITVKYGLHSEDPEEIVELLKEEKSIKFKLGKISLFKGKDQTTDVVKVEVLSPDLHRLNKKIADNVEVTDTFPTYVPHATIAYVKQGTADYLEGNTDLAGLEAEVDELEFSSKKKEKGATRIKLQSAFTPSLVNAPDNKWQSDSDVQIPTKPEWVDCEETWHFPYVKRNVDWDKVLPLVLEIDKEAGPKELALGLGLALAPTSPGATPATTQQTAPAKPAHPVGWEHYEHLISQAAEKFKVPLDLLSRLLKTENDIGNPRAVNPSSGALGLAQFMPATAAELGVNPKDPASSIYGAAKYLRALHKELGNWEDAVRAYNWGPGNVKRSPDKSKDPTETKEYVKKVFPHVKSGRQPATTWDSNEPFSPLPTNWELHTDDGLLNQQYAKQYKGLKNGPYWSNLVSLFNFLAEEDSENNLMYKVVDQGPEHILLKPVQKQAKSSIHEKALPLIKQLKDSLNRTENTAFKASQLISYLQENLADAETEAQARTAVQTTIGHLQELGPSVDSIVAKLQQLLQPEITNKESTLISYKEITAGRQDYADKVIITDSQAIFVPKKIWEDTLKTGFADLIIPYKVYPSVIGFAKEDGGPLHGYKVDFSGTSITTDEIQDMVNDYGISIVRSEPVQLGPHSTEPHSAPETIKDVPTMHPADVQKKRDELLDKMLQLPEGSPERKKIEDKLRAFGQLRKTAETYSDKEQEALYLKTKEDSGDWYKDDVGGGNTQHDWNSSTNDFPQPKDMQKGLPIDQLVPVERRFDRWITPPTAMPPNFMKAPADSGDIDPYDYSKWKQGNLISHKELQAANLIDLVWVRVKEINNDFTQVKGEANLLGKIVPWNATAQPSSKDMRLYRIDTTEIEKAIGKANITAAAQREQLEKVTEMIREQLRATATMTHRNVPSEEQINQLWESVPKVWWTKEESSFLGKNKTQQTTLKLEYVKDLLRRNKFDSNYFTTFPTGRTDKFSWNLVGDKMLLAKY